MALPKLFYNSKEQQPVINAHLKVFSIDGTYSEYSLKLGKNIIGRFVPNENNPDIPIFKDAFVSRFHAVITVVQKENESYTFTLTDNYKNGGGNSSTNGTFYGKESSRLTENDQIDLCSGCVFFIAQTKIILK